jgi:hypothetical protein
MSALFPIPRSTRSIDVTATAGQVSFTFPYPVIAAEDVAVYRRSATGTFVRQVYGAGYVVALVGDGASATVTLLTPCAADDVVRLRGERTATRVTSLAPAGPSFRPSLEAELDNITIVQQELARDARAFNAIDGTFDLGGMRLRNLGAPIANTDAARLQDVLNITTSGTAMAAWSAAGAGAVARTVSDKLQERVSVKDYGATGLFSQDASDAFELALAALKALGGGILFVPAGGRYKITRRILVPSNCWIEGDGYASEIVPTADIPLNSEVFVNETYSPSAAYLRVDSNIRIRRLRFNGANRTYPKYLWNTGSGTAVTNPGQDPTRNSAYATSGYMVRFIHAVNCYVEECYFDNHESFCVVLAGCLHSHVNNNFFVSCGRIDFSSNAIFIGHSGSFRQIVGVTRGATTTLELVSANATVTSQANVYVWGLKGINNAVPNGVYPVTGSTGTTVTIGVDTSTPGLNEWVFDGRALVGTSLCTLSEHCSASGNRGYALNRALLQIGGSSFVHLENNAGRAIKEGCVFLASAFDTTVDGIHADDVNMADIVADGVEINLCVNVHLKNFLSRNTQTYALSVVGCMGLWVDGMTLSDPADAPGMVHPYGPFAEAGAWTGTITTTAGSTAATISPAIAFGPAALSGILVCPNAPAGTTVSWGVDGATAVTLSAPATAGNGATPVAARINPADGPGTALQDFKRYGIFLTSFGKFPLSDWHFDNVTASDTVRNALGLVNYALSGGAAAGSVKRGRWGKLDVSAFGRRGRINGVTNAAVATISTEEPHLLVSGNSVYLRGVVGPTVVNGGPRTVTVTGPNSFQVAVNTAAAGAFIYNAAATWSTANLDVEMLSSSSALDATSVRNSAVAPWLEMDLTGRTWERDPRGRRSLLASDRFRRIDASIAGNASTIINLQGQTTATSDGTATAATITATSRYSRTPRLRSPSAASTGANAGHRFGDFRYLADAGTVSIVFGWEQFQTNAAAFIGLKSTGAHGNADPSSFTNCIGVGIDAGQTTWRVLHNDGAGSCTATNLGALFPANTSGANLYELTLWWDAGGAVVNFQLVNLSTGNMAEAAIATNLPAESVALNTHVIANTRTGSAAVDLAFSTIYGTAA